MKKKPFIDLLTKRGLNHKEIDNSIISVASLDSYLSGYDEHLDEPSESILDQYMRTLIAESKNDINEILALARYYYSIDNQTIYIYFTGILGGLGVIESIKRRLLDVCGQEVCDLVFDQLDVPPIGSPIEDIPVFTKEFMTHLKKYVDDGVYQKILAGNNHQLSKEIMFGEKEAYELSESFDDYLVERHQRQVAELERHMRENKIWFEQQITQPVVDFVKSNPEILSGVRKGNKLYVTKIPYDTANFLSATSPEMQNYYVCHCPFVRTSLLNDDVNISPEWCYCSAGFAKFPFEVILDRELEITLLDTPLKGDRLCRFEIDLGDMIGIKIK